MEHLRVGFAYCGSFCTYDKAMAALEQVRARYGDVTPIVSERSADTDTRFGEAHEFMREMERICDHRPSNTAGWSGHRPLHGQYPGPAGQRL